MKKLFTTLTLVAIGIAAFAQSIYSPGSLPGGSTTAVYSQTITFTIPSTADVDPAIFGLPAAASAIIGSAPLPATISSVILSVYAPSGIAATFDNGSGVYAAGASGTITLNGTPLSGGADSVKITSSSSGSLTAPVVGAVNFPGSLSVPIVGNFPVPPAPRLFDQLYSVTITGPNSIEDLDRNTFSIIQNMPNPFSGNTTIAFSTPAVTKVSLKVFDVLGKEITSQNIQAKSGVNEITFDGSNLKEGVYFYSLTNGNKTFIKKMQVSK